MSTPLVAGERLVAGEFPMLCYHQAGDANRPLVLLAPGGGHLARIFYGHPGARAHDFICHWLALRGYEVLAMSYPSNHDANPHLRPGMTVTDWAAAMVAAAEQCVPSIRAREVVLVGWSMAGRLGHAFKAAANRVGIRAETFISLAATAPLPNLTSPDPAGEPLTAAGLWDSSSRDRVWAEALEQMARCDGALPFSMDEYARHYRCDNPLPLRGEPRVGEGPLSASLAQVTSMLGSFDYGNFPYCGAVIPTSPLDPRHALTDRATWGFLNAQRAWFDCRALGMLGGNSLTEDQWQELRLEIEMLPQRLTREMPGGHFFFVGARGAKATAATVDELIGEITRFRGWLNT